MIPVHLKAKRLDTHLRASTVAIFPRKAGLRRCVWPSLRTSFWAGFFGDIHPLLNVAHSFTAPGTSHAVHGPNTPDL